MEYFLDSNTKQERFQVTKIKSHYFNQDNSYILLRATTLDHEIFA